MSAVVSWGAKLVSSTTVCGVTNQPAAHPARKSGTAESTKPTAYCFSRRFSPGTAKAHT
jgi:hypothetical protein